MKNTNTSISPILKILAYFDVFNYPLLEIEIYRFTQDLSRDEITEELLKLVEEKLVFTKNGLFSLRNTQNQYVERLQGNKLAETYLKKAKRRGKFISKFPFVRAVFISGSFSKGYIDKDGDVDYFIITKNNRMWFARTLLILYKKIFLLNSRKFFCVNYFIGEDNLLIDQNNVFTATEIFTLKPIVNNELYVDLLDKNQWFSIFYNPKKLDKSNATEFRISVFKRIFELVFSGQIGEKTDLFFMKKTIQRWQNKFGNLSKEDFEIAMKSSRNVSKHHPSNFQKKVLSEYNKRIQTLSVQYAESTVQS